MYEVFTDKPFIEGDDPDTIKERVTRSRPRLAHEVNPGVPAEISYILDKATQQSINRRYKSIEHLLADLKQLQLGRPLVGTTIDQKYVLESVLGRGGQGTVFLAYHKGFSRQEEPVAQEDAQDASNNGSGTKKRHVAVKVVDGTDKESIDTFLRESVTTGQIDQRNIVRATDCGQYNDTNYLVLEVLGKSLRSMLTEQGMPTRTSRLYRGNPDDVGGVDYLIKLFEVLADALHYMHERDVTHRDIKPENIMFRNYGTGGAVPLGELHDRVVFTDLGLAMFGGKKEGDQTVSGTPIYYAPEQAEKTRLMREVQMLEILIQRDKTELQALPQKLIDLEKGLQEADEQWKSVYQEEIDEAKAKQSSLPGQIDLWKSKIPEFQTSLEGLVLDTKKIDLYQLGVVMHEAFTARRYIDVQGDYTVIEDAILCSLDSPPSQADAVNPSAPVEISGIIRRLTTRADRRYGSAKEVADDLRRYQKDQSLSFETNPLRRMRKWYRRNARAIKTGSAAAITFIALGTYGVINERKAARIEAERIQRRQLAEQAYDGVLSDYTSMMGSLPDDLGQLEARLADMESLGARVESTRDNNREGLDKDQVDQLNKMGRQLTSRRSDVERGVTRSRMLSRYRALTSECATLLTQDVSLREEDLGSYVSMIAQIRNRWGALSQDRDASTLNDAERQALLQGFTQLDGRVRQLRLSQYEGALAQLRVRIEDATLPTEAYGPLSEDLLSLERRIKGVMAEGQPEPQALTLVSQLNERLTHNQEAARTRETQARETLRLHGVSDERYRQAQVACVTLADIARIGSLTELEGHMVVTAEVPRDTQEVARLRVYTQNLEQARIVLEGARDSARAHEQFVQSPEAEARVREIEGTYARVLARRDFVNFIVTNRELADRRLSEANVAQANGDYKGALRLVIQSMGLDSQDMGPDPNTTQRREHPLQNRFDELNELDRAGEQAIGIEGLTMVSETFAPLYQLHFSFRVAEFAGSEREYGAERDRLIAAVRERVNHLDIPDTTKQTLGSILLTIDEQAHNQANARAQNDDGDALRNANVLRNTVRYMQEAIGEEYRQGRLGDRQRYGLMVEDMRRALIRREVPADPQQAARLDLWREQGRVLYGAVSSGQRAREETDRECIEPLLRAYSSP